LLALRLPERFLLETFFPAAPLTELFFEAPLRAEVLLEEAFFEDALFALLDAAPERTDLLPAAFFEAPPLFTVLAADFEVLEARDDELPVGRERPCLPLPAALSAAVSALTSLLKLLFWPPAVSS
jgi:hypothetical protein